MDRKGHYLKGPGRCTVPAVAFAVVVDERVQPAGPDPDAASRVWGGAHAWCARRVRGRWQAPHETRAETPEELWTWMHSRARRDARNWVLSPVASDALTLSGFWREAEAGGVAWQPAKGKRRGSPEDGVTRFRRLVMRGRPDIVDYTRFGFRWVWLSLSQYLPVGEDELARSIGCPWIDTGRHDGTGTVGLRTARERAHLVLRAFLRLTDWWAGNAKAPFGLTAGQLAIGLLRTHTTPKSVVAHDLAALHRLERECLHGGRAQTFYLGDVGDPARFDSFTRPAPPRSKYGRIDGPLYHVDVRSMYPFLLREHAFPRKVAHVRFDLSPRDLVRACQGHACVATVRVRAARPVAPRSVSGRVTYPVGTFVARLSAPEVLRVAQGGEISEVIECALYDTGPVFRAAAAELIRMREDARARGNYADEFFAKLLANSLGGKLAQRRGVWRERRRASPLLQWGEWIDGRARSGKPRLFRATAGLVWEYVRDPEGGSGLTAAFAHLTALGRLWLYDLVRECPEGSVVSCDTDGLWVTAAGLSALKASGRPWGDRAGELRVADVAEAARFFGPRHYWTPAGWVLAGFRQPEVGIDGATVVDTRVDNPARRSTDRPPDAVVTRTRRSHLAVETAGQVVDADGWCHPAEVGQGN